jgi:hypothetical protein
VADATADDLATREQIAKMEQKKGNHKEVEKYAASCWRSTFDSPARDMFLNHLWRRSKQDEGSMTWRSYRAVVELPSSRTWFMVKA